MRDDFKFEKSLLERRKQRFATKGWFLKGSFEEVADYENSGEHHGCYRIKAQHRLGNFPRFHLSTFTIKTPNPPTNLPSAAPLFTTNPFVIS